MSLHEDIQTRDSGFYFRKAVPLDIRLHIGGKREIIRSLGKDSTKAKILGRELSIKVERIFLDIREGVELHPDIALASLSGLNKSGKGKADQHSTAQLSRDSKLSIALEAYQAERRLPAKTMIEYRAALKRFTEIVGDKPIHAITKADARTYKAMLLKLPKTIPRKLRGATVKKIIAATGDDPTVRKISPKTIQKAMGAISAILGWAEANGVLDANPFSKVKVLLGSHSTPSRLPYSGDDLKAIFSSPLFTGCMNEARRSKPGNVIVRDHSFWLPWLGLYTGCRLEELCQMLLADVRQEQEIWFLDVNTLDEGKHLKTGSSVRRVPVHPRLIELGFLDYVVGLRNAGAVQLFPKLRRDNRGSMSAMWSKFWGRYARKTVKITDPRKVFHSFRHSFKDACRAAQISEEVHDTLTGHSSGSVGRGYGVGVPLPVLNEAIQRIRLTY
jgi:integrase